MNYGRYFRLNQALSKVADGVAIYDYVDLPAYFGPSEENPMSPKYPISVTITSDTVCFRLHYSAFKLDKSGDSDFPQYAYDKDDIDKKALNRKQVDIGMAHMEEVVLELPFADIYSSRLSDTIKNIYNSTFPQVIDENTSMGGRYLEQLIKKRFPVEKDKQSEDSKNSVEDIIYKNLRRVSDETASYSTLWLMDLVREGRLYLYSKQKIIDEKIKKEKEIDVITGFLRKLLLDFMFDLKHSDVFQNSACYQKMYSGLMSDFFFSALMHKCEYYYYRKLINGEIETYNAEADGEKKKIIKERIIKLYVEELSKAEKTWSNDVMSPKSELSFGARQPAGNVLYRMGLTKSDAFRSFPSWFAEPEEEMRRICFPMKEESGDVHICNIDTLKEFLGINTNSKESIESGIDAIRIEMREKISKWFFKRYDFDGTVYFHLSTKINHLVRFACLLILCGCLYMLPCFINGPYILRENLTNRFYPELRLLQYYFPMVILAIVLLCTFGIIYKLGNRYKNKDSMIDSFKYISSHRTCVLVFFLIALAIGINNVFLGVLLVLSLCFRKVLSPVAPICFSVLLFIGYICSALDKMLVYMLFFLFIISIILFDKNQWNSTLQEISFYLKKILSYLHLFFPRLVASITAAWITLTVGFDLYAAFFDSPISWPTAFFIGFVVLIFIMYEINRIASCCSVGRKITRSLELLLVSYTISLIVGIVVIDFVGARFVERGGFDDIFVKEYKHEFKNESKKHGNLKGTLKYSGLPKADELAAIESIKAKIVKFRFGEHDVFYMRDFLFMFAFIAMFIGIFLQMIIFEEKQMTEL